jgi:hypothetical protein
MSRDELIDAIWPDDSPASPDGTLSTLLTRLRATVGHELIYGRSELLLDLGDDACVDWDVATTPAVVAAATEEVPTMTTIVAGRDRRDPIGTHIYVLPVVRELPCPQPDNPGSDPRRNPPGRSPRRGRTAQADRSQAA